VPLISKPRVGFPIIRGLASNLSKIAKRMVEADLNCLRCDWQLCSFAVDKSHRDVAVMTFGGGR